MARHVESKIDALPAEGTYTLMAQAATAYYFGFFIIIMPLLGLFEKPRKVPNSITEAVLAKQGSGKPEAAAAAPENRG